MDQLPLEMVLLVSRHLTDQQVSACSAVCRAWWKLFNNDVIWKARCDLPEREEYLKTTQSIVKPTFASPFESPDSTVNDPCQWRLARLREKHLQNNWRHGRHTHQTIVKHANSEDIVPTLHGFLTDDVVFFVYEKLFVFFDVSINPALKVAEIPHEFTLYVYKLNTLKFVGASMLIVANDSHLEVFHVNLASKTITLKFTFPLAAVNDEHDVDVKIEYVVVGIRIIALIKGEDRLHVWDIASGSKLIEHDLDSGRTLVGVVGSETSEYVAVISSYPSKELELTKRSFYSVYSTKTLSFLPFHFEPQNESMCTPLHTCAVHKQFIAIRIDHHMLVFDCDSRSLMYRGRHGFDEPWNIEILNNCFVFTQNGKLMTYNPLKKSQATFDIEFDWTDTVLEFRDLKSGFVEVISKGRFCSSVIEVLEDGFVEVNLSFRRTCCLISVNRSHSRLMYQEDFRYYLNLDDINTLFDSECMKETSYYFVVNSFW